MCKFYLLVLFMRKFYLLVLLSCKFYLLFLLSCKFYLLFLLSNFSLVKESLSLSKYQVQILSQRLEYHIQKTPMCWLVHYNNSNPHLYILYIIVCIYCIYCIYYIILYCITLYILYYIALHCIVMYCTISSNSQVIVKNHSIQFLIFLIIVVKVSSRSL